MSQLAIEPYARSETAAAPELVRPLTAAPDLDGWALLPALHGAVAGWFAGHGHPVEAIRHAQAARDWDLAVRLLCDHWLGLVLAGRGGTARELLARFPADLAADPELAALRAAEELDRGSLEEADRYLALAAHGSPSVPDERRGASPPTLDQGFLLARTRPASRTMEP